MKAKFLTTVLIGSLFSIASSGFAGDQVFTDQQTTEIQTLVKSYLIKNPEILMEVSEALQQKRHNDMMDKAKQAIPKNASKLFGSNSPFSGNKAGPINIVEFFDNQCGHCRSMHATLAKVVKANKDVKIIYKEFPMFGDVSEYASKMGLAANKQNKYGDFHNALMEEKPPLTKAKIENVAKRLELDMQKLEKDMKSKEVEQELADNAKLAQSIGIMGAPAFIVADQKEIDMASEKGEMKSFFVPGALSPQMLEGLLNEARGKTVEVKKVAQEEKAEVAQKNDTK